MTPVDMTTAPVTSTTVSTNKETTATKGGHKTETKSSTAT